MSALVTTWAIEDPFAAGLWLDQLPDGIDRDHAISGYVIQLSRLGEFDDVVDKWLDGI